MTLPLQKVHPVHQINIAWMPGSSQPLDQANQLQPHICLKWQL